MYGLITLMGFGIVTASFISVIARWFTFENVKHQAELDFMNKRDKFYSAFWNFYPRLKKRKFRASLPKFFIYYLAQRGFITIDVDEANNVRLIRNPVDTKMNSPESFLMGLLFGNSDWFEYTSTDSILGSEAVSLEKVGAYYSQNVDKCPIREGFKNPLATTESTRAIDYKTMTADQKRFKAASIFIFFIAPFSSALIEANGYDIGTTVLAYYMLLGLGTFVISKALKTLREMAKHSEENLLDPEKPKKIINYLKPKFWVQVLKEKGHPEIASMLNVMRAAFWIFSLFVFFIFNFALVTVTGAPLSQLLILYSVILVFIMWLGTLLRENRKDYYYSSKVKSNKGYIKFLKQAFKPSMISRRAETPDDLTFLLPYASLYGKSAQISEKLPVESATPAWITQTREKELNFEEVDALISKSISKDPLPKN